MIEEMIEKLRRRNLFARVEKAERKLLALEGEMTIIDAALYNLGKLESLGKLMERSDGKYLDEFSTETVANTLADLRTLLKIDGSDGTRKRVLAAVNVVKIANPRLPENPLGL